MESRKKILGIVILGAIVVGAILLRLSGKRSEEIASAPASESQVQILEEGAKEESQANIDSFRERVAWDRAEREIDLKRTPLPIENGEAVLNVEIATKGTCFPGDANAIEMDLKAAPEHKLLATLESLSGGGTSLFWDVPKDFLAKGSASHQFRLPVKKEPAQYGFFICTALSSDKRCGTKTIRDVNEIFTEHIRKDPNAGKELRNIFFQYFLLDNRGLSAFSSPPKGDAKFEALKTYVRQREAAGNVNQEIDIAKKNIQTLVSFPFVFKDKKLKVELPQYNLAACDGQ